MNNFDKDLRLKWIKYVIYKLFNFNSEDSCFEDLQEEENFQSAFLDIFTQQNQRCIFFYYTIIEEEIENEVLEAVEAKIEAPDKFHSDAVESEDSISSEEKDVQENETPDMAMENDILENEATVELADELIKEQNNESRKKSTTSLMLIVKKIKLHFCVNVSKYIPSRSYVYFLRRPDDSLPDISSEQVLMSRYFEIGYLSQHPLICIEKIISNLYIPMLEDVKYQNSAKTYKAHKDKSFSDNELLTEITFWKSQKLKFGVCCNQLGHPNLVKTLEILRLAECDFEEFQKNMSRLDKELARITDIVNYLLLLELKSKEILSDTVRVERTTLDDLFVVLKMIWIQSDYYQSANNMSRIFKGVAELLKNKVKRDACPHQLFRMPPEKSEMVVTDLVDILKYWKEVYLKESMEVKMYGTGYRWTFDIRTFCDHTDYMVIICEDLKNILKKLQELHNIFKTNLRFFVENMKDLNALKNRAFGMTVIIHYVQFDIFDPNSKTQWTRVLQCFFSDIKSFENEMTRYLRTLFQNTLSWENAYTLSGSFDKVSSLIKEFVAESRSDMLKQFLKEIAEEENLFIARERNQPLFGELPESASAMLWIQDLTSKIVGPITQISENETEVEKLLET